MTPYRPAACSGEDYNSAGLPDLLPLGCWWYETSSAGCSRPREFSRIWRISKVNGQWYSMVESGKTKFSCRFHKFSLNFSWADQSRKAAQSATRCEAVVLAFDVCTPCALCGSEERAGHIGQKVRFVKGSPLDPLGLAQNRDLDWIIDGLYIYKLINNYT